tara:strand:+ start:377 stop:529 length:153 start_codon:yes stop_codon:yes gene_type:complete
MKILNYDIEVIRGTHEVTTNEWSWLDDKTLAINIELIDAYIIIERISEVV